MKQIALKTSCFTLCLLAAITSFADNKYPVVLSSSGSVSITGGDNKKIPASKGKILQGKALLEVGPRAQLKIQWDAQRTATFFSDTIVNLPAISWESGEAPLVILKSGQLRWQALGAEAYKVAFHSELFEFISPAADFIISFDPKKPQAEVQVFDGRMEFSAMNAEETVLVQKNQKATFVGVLEDGAIAYDILLQGKKIPRGKLAPVQTLSSAEMSLVTREEDEAKRLNQKKAQEEKARIQKKKVTGQICDRPAARLNDCSWTCEGNPKKAKTCEIQNKAVSCVRRRCNASGEWAEESKLAGDAKSLCKSTPVVAPCDY